MKCSVQYNVVHYSTVQCSALYSAMQSIK